MPRNLPVWLETGVTKCVNHSEMHPRPFISILDTRASSFMFRQPPNSALKPCADAEDPTSSTWSGMGRTGRATVPEVTFKT